MLKVNFGFKKHVFKKPLISPYCICAHSIKYMHRNSEWVRANITNLSVTLVHSSSDWARKSPWRFVFRMHSQTPWFHDYIQMTNSGCIEDDGHASSRFPSDRVRVTEGGGCHSHGLACLGRGGGGRHLMPWFTGNTDRPLRGKWASSFQR